MEKIIKNQNKKFRATCNRIIKNPQRKILFQFKKDEIITNLDLTNLELKNGLDIMLKKGYFVEVD